MSALIPGAVEEGGQFEVPVSAVVPNPKQPRTVFSEDALEGLSASIREVGVLQPIVVRKVGEGFVLIAGERRLRAAQSAGLAMIPAVVRDSDDTESLREALIENIHREDLGPIELAEAFRELLEELGATQETLADRLGVSRSHIANTIRLLQLAPDCQRLLGEAKIQAGHGRALLALPEQEAQVSLALRTAAEDLSVREVEELVRNYTEHPAAATATPAEKPVVIPDTSVAEVEEILSEQLATRVRVQTGKKRGRIIVEFGSPDDLERIVSEIVGSGPGLSPD